MLLSYFTDGFTSDLRDHVKEPDRVGAVLFDHVGLPCSSRKLSLECSEKVAP